MGSEGNCLPMVTLSAVEYDPCCIIMDTEVLMALLPPSTLLSKALLELLVVHDEEGEEEDEKGGAMVTDEDDGAESEMAAAEMFFVALPTGTANLLLMSTLLAPFEVAAAVAAEWPPPGTPSPVPRPGTAVGSAASWPFLVTCSELGLGLPS
ncbi:hypothetical protein HDE_05603 [Halotydeus destructor]|nr:hypothetical protein HDE_05603 [Halotydeus destructor]